MQTTSIRTVLGAAVLALVVMASPRSSQAAVVVYDQTITTGAVANPNVDSFNNCLAAEGCLGNAGLVDVVGGNLPNTLPYLFTLSSAQVALLQSAPNLVSTFTVVASRDIGGKAGATPDKIDTIAVSAEGSALGNLFETTIDTCPAGERGVDYPATLVCGPNFHTDVTAADTLSITTALIKSLAADGSINFLLDPEDSVGRLKIFSLELKIVQAVPEPGSMALLLSSLFLLGLMQRRRQAFPIR